MDEFGTSSQGELRANIVSEPPPTGLGYQTTVPSGYVLNQWIIADIEADGPRRSFWVIPKLKDGPGAGYAEQAGRSRNSIAFAGVPLPADADTYVIEFRQWVHDNDTIGFIVGAAEPRLEHNGVEIRYQRQLPGTDETVSDIYYKSPWGEGRILDRALMFRWVQHRLEIRPGHLAWFQDGEVMLAGAVEALGPGGWFGIRQCYERGTRYDDVRITVRRQPAPTTLPE